MAGPLTLTTPPMRGPEARRAKELLSDNPFGDFLDDEVDNVFDESAARGCRLARYWLGYREQDQIPVFGKQLAGYLEGADRLPPARRARRAMRIRIRPRRLKRARVRALELAKRHVDEIGEHPAASNNNKFTRWYMRNPDGWDAPGEGPEWCAIFITWCYAHARWPTDAFDRGKSRWASCPALRNAARAGDYGLSIIRRPRPGDLAIYDLPPTTDDDSLANHIGMFEKWVEQGKTFTAIEGNLSDKVQRVTRERSIVTAFIRVGADEHPPK